METEKIKKIEMARKENLEKKNDLLRGLKATVSNWA